MTAPSEDLISRLQAAAAEARSTVRELHEARADARQLLRELDAKVATVRSEVVEAHNELAMREWDRAMESINLKKLGAGLKESFDQWVNLLGDANQVLTDLRKREVAVAELLAQTMAKAKGRP